MANSQYNMNLFQAGLRSCQETLALLLNKRKEVVRQLDHLESDIVYNREQIIKLEEKIRVLDESTPKDGEDYDYTLD